MFFLQTLAKCDMLRDVNKVPQSRIELDVDKWSIIFYTLFTFFEQKKCMWVYVITFSICAGSSFLIYRLFLYKKRDDDGQKNKKTAAKYAMRKVFYMSMMNATFVVVSAYVCLNPLFSFNQQKRKIKENWTLYKNCMTSSNNVTGLKNSKRNKIVNKNVRREWER